MSNQVKKPKNKQKQNMVEIAFISAAVEKGGKIFEEMTQGGSILEYSLHEAEMSIRAYTHGIDKNGDRFDPETQYIISIKGSTEKPKTPRKADLGKASKKDSSKKEKDDAR